MDLLWFKIVPDSRAGPCLKCFVGWLGFFLFCFSVAQLKSCSLGHVHKLGLFTLDLLYINGHCGSDVYM